MEKSVPASPQGKFVRGGVQGESDMLSVPPVRTTSASPSLISCAALMIVWKPLPHNLSVVSGYLQSARRPERLVQRSSDIVSLLTDLPVDGQGRNVDRQSRQVPDMPSQVGSRRIRIQHLTVSRERDSRARGIFTRETRSATMFGGVAKTERARTHPKMTESTLTPSGSSANAALAACPPSCPRRNGASRRVGVSQPSPVRQRRAGARARTCEAVRLLRLPPKAPNAVRFAEAM